MSEQFDQQLRDSLRRTNAPDGFAERVLAEAARRSEHAKAQANAPTSKSRRWWQWAGWRHSWSAAGVAVLLLLIVTAIYGIREKRELARQRAGEEALYALRLTNEKIAPARKALAQLGLRLDELSNAESERQAERP